MELNSRSPLSASLGMVQPESHSPRDYTSLESKLRCGLFDSPQDLQISSPTLCCGSNGIRSPIETHSWHRERTSSPYSQANVLSAVNKSFAPFDLPFSAHSQNEVHSSQRWDISVLPSSVFTSVLSSQRSSFSAAFPSDLHVPVGHGQDFTPPIKMEDGHDYTLDDNTLATSSPRPASAGFVFTNTAYSRGPEAELNLKNFQPRRPIAAYRGGGESLSSPSSPTPPFEGISEHQDYAGRNGQRKRSSSGARIRLPRKLTTKEEANFQCHVPGCGKIFSRSYNFKAHMDTHDTYREYPFLCLTPDCDKKFVRKTDLQRHYQSVHAKQRNYRCDYCSRNYARKDTLRRHMEDGCSKRFDIETVDLELQEYDKESPIGSHVWHSLRNSANHTPSHTPSSSTIPQGAKEAQ